MILSLLLFGGVAFLLTFEGKLLLQVITRGNLTRSEVWMLGFPMGAFINVLLFFLCTLMNIPLTFWVIVPGHVMVVVVIYFLMSREDASSSEAKRGGEGQNGGPPLSMTLWKKLLISLLLISIAIKLFFAFSHAILLPTLYYDSLSQWNHRAQVSYEDRAIAFDRDESRGVSKPQYPILTHSLQILFMLPQGQWLDRISNASTFLLTLSSFIVMFLLLQRRTGTFFALLAIAALFMVPLAVIHTGQGLADIHVIEYLLLSAFFLVLYTEGITSNKKPVTSNLLLSATFCAAAAWVKQEGLFFGVVPWIVLMILWTFLEQRSWKTFMRFGLLPVLALGMPWTLFMIAQGLPLGAHAGGFRLEWHSEAIPKIRDALFTMGSFGVYFYVIPVVLVVTFITMKNHWNDHLPSLLVIGWGLLTFAEALAIYLLTPNVQFLLNSQTFHRTMMIPLSLLLMGGLFLVHSQGWFFVRSSSPSSSPSPST